MRLAIAALLLATSAGIALAQTTTPGTTTALIRAAAQLPALAPEQRQLSARELRATYRRQLLAVRKLLSPAVRIRRDRQGRPIPTSKTHLRNELGAAGEERCS